MSTLEEGELTASQVQILSEAKVLVQLSSSGMRSCTKLDSLALTLSSTITTQRIIL